MSPSLPLLSHLLLPWLQHHRPWTRSIPNLLLFSHFSVPCVANSSPLTHLAALTVESLAPLAVLSAINWSSVAKSSRLPKSLPRFHPAIDNLNKRIIRKSERIKTTHPHSPKTINLRRKQRRLMSPKTLCLTLMSTYPQSILMKWITLRTHPYLRRTYLTKSPRQSRQPISSRLLAHLSLPSSFLLP